MLSASSLLLSLPLLALTAVLGFSCVATLNRLRTANRRAHELDQSRLAAQKSLTEERKTLLATLQASGSGIVVTGPDDRILTMNQALVDMLGVGDPEQWTGRSAHALWRLTRQRIVDSPEVAELENGLQNERSLTVEIETCEEPIRNLMIESNAIPAIDGRPRGRLTVVRNLTEQRQTQDERLQARILETIATLAGGVAHDFNNKLTAILGNTRRIREMTDGQRVSGERVISHLDDLEAAADYCARLTSGLLSFSSRTPLHAETVRVASILDQAATILRRDHPERIELRMERDDPELTTGRHRYVRCAPQEVVQILVHLVDNARRAIDERGTITVRANELVSDEGQGPWIQFEVEDDGRGMERSIRDRAFDPFFTTRTVGQGTGLGLSIAYGLVQAQGGWIEVDSKPGHGTRCTFYLPAGDPNDVTNILDRQTVGHSELILVADDEAPLRRLIRLALEQRGFRVIEAADGLEALERFRDHRSEIAMAILDLSMPNLDGLQVIEQIHLEEPTLPIILSSGYFGERPPPDDDSVAILPKPYSPDRLVELVNENVHEASFDQASSARRLH